MAPLGRLAALLPLLALPLACVRSVPPSTVGTASRAAIEEPKPAVEGAQRARLPHDVVARAAMPFYGLRYDDGGHLSPRGLAEELADANVICIGESHDNPHHHWAQLALLDRLLRLARHEGREIAVGFEMFQTPFQGALDDWSEGKTDDEELLEQSEWNKRWGFDFNLYRPLLERGRRDGAQLLALNAPRELTQKIAREGLRGLSKEERKKLPEMDLHDRGHREWFRAATREHPAPHSGFRRMYAAQVAWDETMAHVSSRWLDKRLPARQLIVIAGVGHCQRSAIPDRIARRTRARIVAVKPVLQKAAEDPCPALVGFDYGVILQANP